MPDRLLLLPEPLQPATAGPILREYRLMGQHQRKDIARGLGVAPATLSNWEFARRPFNADYLVKFAHALDLEVVLFDREEFSRTYPDHIKRIQR